MKKILLSAVLVLVATNVFAALSGSKHDLSTATGPNATYNGTSDQLCKYCHVPHNATTTTALWARTNGSATSFYVNATMDATAAAPSLAASTACLSCHTTTATAGFDASTALGANITGAKLISGAGANDLTNDHPIGFLYNAALATADGGLVTPTVNYKVGTAGTALPLFGAVAAPGGTLECATCHAVHGVGTIPMFLRTTNAGSVLCLKCHSK